MPVEKPEIFSGFLRFSPFPSLFQNSILSKNKKMPNAVFDLLRGIGLVERYFRSVFREIFSRKTALFSFFLNKTLLNFCGWERRGSESPTHKKRDLDCRYCLYYSKGKCKLQWCCCYQDKVRTGSPFTPNMNEKPHRYRAYNKNTIDVQTFGQNSMVFSFPISNCLSSYLPFTVQYDAEQYHAADCNFRAVR